MEISKIKIAGCEVSVIFTGEEYIFHNAVWGIVAFARRDMAYLEAHRAEDGARFTLWVENYQTKGGSLNYNSVSAGAVKFIRACETRYINLPVDIEVIDGGDLNAKYYINCAISER